MPAIKLLNRPAPLADEPIAPCRPRLSVRLRVAANSNPLDEAIASGVDSARSSELRLRAAQLVGPTGRGKVAEGLERAVRDADASGGWLDPAAPLNRAGLKQAGPALEELASLLRSERAVHARGVAKARLLLVDPAGPLFRPGDVQALQAAVEDVREALVGTAKRPRAAA